jgi:hypothetical protein
MLLTVAADLAGVPLQMVAARLQQLCHTPLQRQRSSWLLEVDHQQEQLAAASNRAEGCGCWGRLRAACSRLQGRWTDALPACCKPLKRTGGGRVVPCAPGEPAAGPWPPAASAGGAEAAQAAAQPDSDEVLAVQVAAAAEERRSSPPAAGPLPNGEDAAGSEEAAPAAHGASILLISPAGGCIGLVEDAGRRRPAESAAEQCGEAMMHTS